MAEAIIGGGNRKGNRTEFKSKRKLELIVWNNPDEPSFAFFLLFFSIV